MQSTPESEIKLTVNELEWTALFREAGGDPALIAAPGDGEIRLRPLGWHFNYYFDDPAGTLERLGVTLRLRPTEPQGPLFTLKVPKDLDVDGARRSTELTWALTGYTVPARLEVARLPDLVRGTLATLGVTGPVLPRVGSMQTLRVPMLGGKVVLDRCELPNGFLHFEVEIESEDPAERAALLARVRALCPGAIQDPRPKFQRLMAALRG